MSFKTKMLIDIVSNDDMNYKKQLYNYSYKDLIALVHEKLNFENKCLPILISKQIVKSASLILVDKFPKASEYISPRNIKVEIEPNEKLYLIEQTLISKPQNILFITGKNILTQLTGISLSKMMEAAKNLHPESEEVEIESIEPHYSNDYTPVNSSLKRQRTISSSTNESKKMKINDDYQSDIFENDNNNQIENEFNNQIENEFNNNNQIENEFNDDTNLDNFRNDKSNFETKFNFDDIENNEFNFEHDDFENQTNNFENDKINNFENIEIQTNNFEDEKTNESQINNNNSDNIENNFQEIKKLNQQNDLYNGNTSSEYDESSDDFSESDEGDDDVFNSDKNSQHESSSYNHQNNKLSISHEKEDDIPSQTDEKENNEISKLQQRQIIFE